MKNLQISLLVSFIILGSFLLPSCTQKPSLYKKEFTEAEKSRIDDKMTTRLLRKYNQGSISEIKVLHEALKLQPEEAHLWREIGIPYGKRGFAAEFYENYGKAAKYDPLNWQGWRGYMYLYFYRDYERALQDFNELDALTPNFVDHPQATSIHYMRAICHLQMDQYEKAHSYWDLHIAEESKSVGEEYIDSKTYLLHGITFYKQDNLNEAMKSFEKGILYDKSNANLWYWKAKLAHQLGNQNTAAEAVKKAKYYYHKESYNDRSYNEEFYQTYLLDIETLQAKIEAPTKEM